MHFIPICILAIDDKDDCNFMQMLYVEHALMMYRIAFQITNNQKDADDAVSNACEALIRKVDILRTMSYQVRCAYIMSTVRNQAFMVMRKRQVEHRALKRYSELERALDHTPEPDITAIQHVTLQEVIQAIRQLPARDQDVMRMKFFENMSTAEIAAYMGVQQSTVQSMIKRARKRLYAAMQENQDEQ